MALYQLSKGRRFWLLGIVCDGIGGLPEGENASGYVVRQVLGWFRGSGYKIKKQRKLRLALGRLLFQLHEELKDYGRHEGICLGTTVTFFFIRNKQLIWGHLGDSRLYFFHQKKLNQLTIDHQEEDGALNRALGVGSWRGVSMGRKRIRKGDRILLCTDGFYRGLLLEELYSYLACQLSGEEQMKRLLQQIAERKLTMGEQDNLSALYCAVE